MLLDGHHVESVERGKHGTADPRRILSVQGRVDLDLSLGILVGKVAEFVLEPVWEVFHESGATG